ETQVGEIDLPAAAQSAPLRGDDAGVAQLVASDKISQLSDGYRMVWERDSAPLKANQAIWFRFRIEDSKGNPATDLENYMGMAGHARLHPPRPHASAPRDTPRHAPQLSRR